MSSVIRLCVGETTSNIVIDNSDWLMVWATFELRVYPKEGRLRVLDTSKGVPCFFYGTDGNTAYHNDYYGRPLRAVPAEEVIQALRDDGGHWCLPSLEALNRKFAGWYTDTGTKQLRVVLYGH